MKGAGGVVPPKTWTLTLQETMEIGLFLQQM